MQAFRPTTLQELDNQVGPKLARLSGLEGFARSILVGTVPLVALERLGSKNAVSVVYTFGALLAFTVTLNLGTLERAVQRRWVLTIGTVMLFAAAILFIPDLAGTLVAAVGFRSAAASIFSVCLTLYIMDYVDKLDLPHNESRRMVANGLAWLIGPSLGIWLWQNVGSAAPFLVSASCSSFVLVYFWHLRLRGSPIVGRPKTPPDNPVKNIIRYFSQKHLRVAYSITLVRSMFWVSAFVYGPIYIVEAGYDETIAGLFLSGLAGLLFLSPVVRRIAERIGARQTIIGGFVLIGAMMIALGSLGEPRRIGIAFWALAAVGGVALDTLGNIPFIRTVKRRERGAMVTVFSTWREMSEVTAPLLAIIVLAATAPFWMYYIFIGLLALMTASFASLLPRRI